MILHDTNGISDLTGAKPPADRAYVGRLAADTVFKAAICEAEIRYGLARMAGSRKRNDLVDPISKLFDPGFRGRVLLIGRHCAVVCGTLAFESAL